MQNAPALDFSLGYFILPLVNIAIGFYLIWVALLLYSVEGLRNARKQTAKY